LNSKLIIISAPSGAGKTTLCDTLLKEFQDTLVLSISYTTRKPRSNEINGVDYNFISKDAFESKLKDGEFAEWAEVHGNYYGTSKHTINETLKRGKSVLLDIDVQGAKSLTDEFKGRCITIFIIPPDMETLEERLRTRGTDEESVIKKRIKNAERELERINEFQHKIVNDRFDHAYGELKKILVKELEIKTK